MEHTQIDYLVDLYLMLGHRERATQYEVDGIMYNESVGAHTAMLVSIALHLSPDWLDKGLIAYLAVHHDLPEAITGDYSTLLKLTPEVADKRAREEEEALSQIENLLPELAKDIRDYEAHTYPEARFVHYVDKMLPKMMYKGTPLPCTREQMEDRYIKQGQMLREQSPEFTELHDIFEYYRVRALERFQSLL